MTRTRADNSLENEHSELETTLENMVEMETAAWTERGFISRIQERRILIQKTMQEALPQIKKLTS
jgi:hypothetical protein